MSEDKLPDVAAEDLLEPTASGFLDKKRPSKNFLPDKYQKRWCVIYNRNFYYFERPTDRKQKGAFSLRGYRVKPSATDNRSFTLVSEGKDRHFYFIASSSEEVLKWQTAVFKASRGGNIRSETNAKLYDSPPPPRHISKINPSQPKHIPNVNARGVPERMEIYGSCRNKPTRHDSLPTEEPSTSPSTPRNRSSSEPYIPKNALTPHNIESLDSPALYAKVSKPNLKTVDTTARSSPPTVPRRPPPQRLQPNQDIKLPPKSVVSEKLSVSPKQTSTGAHTKLIREQNMSVQASNEISEKLTQTFAEKRNLVEHKRNQYKTQRANYIVSETENVNQDSENETQNSCEALSDIYSFSDSDDSDYADVDEWKNDCKSDNTDDPVYDKPENFRVSLNESDGGYVVKMNNKVPSKKARSKVRKNYSLPNIGNCSSSDVVDNAMHNQSHEIKIGPTENYFPHDEYGYVIFVPLENPVSCQDDNESEYDTVSRLSSASDMYSTVAEIEKLSGKRLEEVETADDIISNNRSTEDQYSHSDENNDYVNVQMMKKLCREANENRTARDKQLNENCSARKEESRLTKKEGLPKRMHMPVRKHNSEALHVNRRVNTKETNIQDGRPLNKSKFTRLQVQAQRSAIDLIPRKSSLEYSSDSSEGDYESVG